METLEGKAHEDVLVLVAPTVRAGAYIVKTLWPAATSTFARPRIAAEAGSPAAGHDLQHRLPASGPVFGWRRRLQIRDELVPGVEQFLLVDDVGTAEDGASLVAGEEQGEPPRVREVLLFLAARGLRSRV